MAAFEVAIIGGASWNRTRDPSIIREIRRIPRHPEPSHSIPVRSLTAERFEEQRDCGGGHCWDSRDGTHFARQAGAPLKEAKIRGMGSAYFESTDMTGPA